MSRLDLHCIYQIYFNLHTIQITFSHIRIHLQFCIYFGRAVFSSCLLWSQPCNHSHQSAQWHHLVAGFNFVCFQHSM
jgi:hypothetical protein